MKLGKIVLQESCVLEETFSDSLTRFEAFEKLVNTFQDIFRINNSKHNSIGFINGLCSEHLGLEIEKQMKNSLNNPKSNTGD